MTGQTGWLMDHVHRHECIRLIYAPVTFPHIVLFENGRDPVGNWGWAPDSSISSKFHVTLYPPF